MPNVATNLTMPPETHDEIWRHLLQNDREQVAFAFADTELLPEELTFKLEGVFLVPPEGLEVHESYHVSLTDDTQAKVIKEAWDRQQALVEFHSHRGIASRAVFSPSDLSGLKDFVPHVRWRLQGKPYLALVVADADFDALVWRDDVAEGLTHVTVAGRLLCPTGLTVKRLRR